MSVSTRVIVQGDVLTVSRRTGKARVSGEEYAISTCLVLDAAVGALAEVSFFEGEGVKVPAVGQKVRMLCVVGVFRDDDSVSFEKYLG